MIYYSTKNKNLRFSFRNAVLTGLAPDGGLFMPSYIPKLDNDFLKNISSFPFNEIALKVASIFTEDEIGQPVLETILNDAINFPAPVIRLDNSYSILELFHGPTLAFKDFGARFMSRTMSYFIQNEERGLNILVATSGDTGSAVANGFLGVDGINVFVLYPSGKISRTQEKQITTLGNNITALEINGTFDDCQKLVKTAFLDKDIQQARRLSSANSINIARLIPQSFYYFEAYKQIQEKSGNVIFSVPSGNLGNLTAGLFAKQMGLPVYKFIGATNRNDVFTEYLDSGQFNPRPSVKTYSNAMDVGSPSNLARIIDLYKNDLSVIRSIIFSRSYTDNETLSAIKFISDKYNYIIDPHGAVGFLALRDFLNGGKMHEASGIVLETAHPAKFEDVVKNAVDAEIEFPERLKACLSKDKVSIKLSNDYAEFKDYMTSK